MNRVPIAGVIVEKDGKLLMHRRNFEPAKGKIDLIGGFVDDGETIEQAAIREAKEETGFDVELVEKFLVLDYFEREEKILHVFIAKIKDGELSSSEEGEPIWIKIDDIDNIERKFFAFPHVTQTLDAYLKRR